MSESIKLTTTQKIKWVILLIALLVLWIVPCGEVYTQQVKYFCMISVAGIYMMAFELVPAFVAALAIPTGYWLLSVAPTTTVFSAWTQQVPWVLLGSLLVAQIMNKTGLSKRLAYGLMIIGKGNFYIVMAMLIIAGAIIAAFVPAAVARAALFGSIALSLADAMEWEADKKHAIILFSVVGLAATGCSYMLMTGTNSDLVVAGVLESAGYPISWSEWAFYNMIPGIIEIIAAFVLILIMFKNHDSEETEKMDSRAIHAYIKEQYKTLGKPDKQEKKAIVLFAVILVLLLTSNYHSFNPGQIFMLLALIAFLPGIGLLKAEDAKKINYSTLFLVAGCVAIGDVANALALGDVFVNLVMPLLPDSIVGLSAISFFICFFGNMLMTPVALGSTLTLPIINIAEYLGCNPYGLTMIFWTSCGATVFPYEAASDLLIFSYGKISMKNWIKVGILRSLVLFIGRFVLYIPWFKLLGLL